MVRTSIYLEVDDDVYEKVIKPHKESKTFSKLMASLLKGYIEDEYVRSYGDGTLDDMKKASVSALEGVIGDMRKSLSTLGLYNDALSANMQKGSKTFSGAEGRSRRDEEVSEKANAGWNAYNPVDGYIAAGSESIVGGREGSQFDQSGRDDEIVKIKSTISNLSSRIEKLGESDDKMLEMMNTLLSRFSDPEKPVGTQSSINEGTIVDNAVDKVSERVIEKPVETSGNVSSHQTAGEVQVVEEHVEEVDEDTPSQEGLDLIKSMLSGNDFSFDF